MAEKPDQIEQHIASARHELGNNLNELELKVKQAADWKTYYERKPMTMVGLAFGGGVLLATLMGSRRERNGTFREQVPTSAGYLTGASQNGPASDIWENVKAALIGLSGAKLRSFLDEALPGFGDHYDRAMHANAGTRATSPYPETREYEVPSHRM